MASRKGATFSVQMTRGVHHMFASQNHRRDFADTRALGPEPVLTLAGISRWETGDAGEQLALADAADSRLLGLVMCVAGATLVLALVSSLA